MQHHPVVPQEQWFAARKALLLKEKELTHLRDRINAERLALPWVKVEKNYEIEPYKKRMGWRFSWVSAFGTDFNYDYHVSFTDHDLKKGKVLYNFTETPVPDGFRSTEFPGVSSFYKDAGEVFHTYSSYARGGED